MGFLSRCMLTLTGHGKNSLTDNLMLGSIVVFGSYQSVTGTKQPLTWRVLFSHGGKVLLITEHSITERLYHHTHAQANWEKSNLRQWLNGEFFEDTFTESEKKLILDASSVSSVDIFPKGSAVSDKLPEDEPPLCSGDHVFILSEAEVRRFFKNEEDACCSTFGDQHEPECSQSVEGASWWLRTPGTIAGCAAYVDKKGNVNKHGTNVFLPGTFVRPAIWIRPKEPLTVLKTAALRTENSDGWRDWKYEEYRKSLVVNPFFKLEGTHRKGAIRSDEEMASVDKENAEASFKKQKKILTDFMKEHGFIKYKTNAYIRRNECDVLEYLNLQKEKYGSKTLTINYALIPLYIPHDFISFDLGGRLGELICGNDVWWDYANDSLAETGFRNIIKAIDEILLPWFDNHASSEALKLELQKMKSVGYSISRIQQNWLDLLLQDRPVYDPEIIRRNLEMFGIPNIQKRKTP